MTKIINRGFSLVELCITCAITAVVGAVAITAYNNINSQAQLTAQNRDQAVLNQVMSAYNLTGGNLQYITTRDSDRAAQAMTLLFQGYVPDAATQAVVNEIKTTKGTVYSGLSPDMIIVPESTANANANDKHSRIYVDAVGNAHITTLPLDGSGGTVLPAPATTSFVATNKTSKLGVTALAVKDYTQNPSADNKNDVKWVINSQSLSGTKYADNNAYIYKEDAIALNSHYIPPGPNPIPVIDGTKSNLTIDIQLPNAGAFTYWQYTDGNPANSDAAYATVTISRSDSQKALGKFDVSITPTFTDGLNGTGNVVGTFSGSLTISQPDAGHIVAVIPLQDVLPAKSWNLQKYSFNIKVDPNTADINGASQSAPVAATLIPLVVDADTSHQDLDADGIFNTNNSITIDASHDSTDHDIDTSIATLAVDNGGSSVKVNVSGLVATVTP